MEEDQENQVNMLSNLLREISVSHENDFAEENGVDPNWPEYYAERVFANDDAREVLCVSSESEVVVMLKQLSEEVGNSMDWPVKYARRLIGCDE